MASLLCVIANDHRTYLGSESHDGSCHDICIRKFLNCSPNPRSFRTWTRQSPYFGAVALCTWSLSHRNRIPWWWSPYLPFEGEAVHLKRQFGIALRVLSEHHVNALHFVDLASVILTEYSSCWYPAQFEWRIYQNSPEYWHDRPDLIRDSSYG